MKKTTIFILVLSILLLVGCNIKSNDSGEKNIKSAHMNVAEGKIVEIKEDNTLLLEIIKERGGYKKGEKVLVKYNKFQISDASGDDLQVTEAEPALNDEVGIQFWPDTVTKKDGYDYIEVKTVEKIIIQ